MITATLRPSAVSFRVTMFRGSDVVPIPSMTHAGPDGEDFLLERYSDGALLRFGGNGDADGKAHPAAMVELLDPKGQPGLGAGRVSWGPDQPRACVYPDPEGAAPGAVVGSNAAGREWGRQRYGRARSAIEAFGAALLAHLRDQLAHDVHRAVGFARGDA